MAKNGDPTQLHQRYSVQASWTVLIREKLLRDSGIDKAAHCLEVGAGTGAITADIVATHTASCFALDKNPTTTKFGYENIPSAHWCVGDGSMLPFPKASFDVVFCHFLLMWVERPLEVLKEMSRVTTPTGFVICMAEPDYGGRIDYPHPLEALGELQFVSLTKQGADPRMGSKLLALYREAGLREVRVGVLGGEWDLKPNPQDYQSELQTLMGDLKQVDRNAAQDLLELDQQSWETGERILFVPTFYAIARVG
jgi:SAM-dependent methyltransferase